MVYKGKFLKQAIENDFDPTVGTHYTWELSDQALSAIWITIKGDLYAIDQCIDDYMSVISALDVWFGSFNVDHYTVGIKALLMNCKLKQHVPYLLANSQTAADVGGVTFPIMFGAPYLNDKMCLPKSLDNRKKLDLTFGAQGTHLNDILIDISEVIMIDASPLGFIKQEQVDVQGRAAAGEQDVWLQTNWDVLKFLLYSYTVPTGTVYTSTIERAGIEIDDLPFGYKSVPWEHLHAEMMDELDGDANMENHVHLATSGTGLTGVPSQNQHWLANYGQMDFFFEKDLKWKCPCAGASTAKMKLYIGDTHDWSFVPAYYVPTSKVM